VGRRLSGSIDAPSESKYTVQAMNDAAAMIPCPSPPPWSGPPNPSLVSVAKIYGLPDIRLDNREHHAVLSSLSLDSRDKAQIHRLVAWGEAAVQFFNRQGGDHQLLEHDLLPGGYLLDQGALFQLLSWESAGLCYYLTYDVPSFADAIDHLKEKIIAFMNQHPDAIFGELTGRVLAFCAEHLAGHDHDAFDADVVVQAETAAGVECLADFLWQFRHLGVTS
jgi:hypothetical protein